MHRFRPESRRLAKALGLVVVVAAIGAPGAQAEAFIPGVTDFPSRVHSKPTFVPGVSDFPSRLGAKAEQAARRRVALTQASEWPLVTAAARDFDWATAGIGALIFAGALSGAAIALRTRPRLRFGRAH